ncbi:vegetative cell wall protein gp1-like [Sphaeramia orbicularis]|uniref:vegetative cell wall protein gp1-like n=1 Tax=Sphaeramia orbicularis TaxID=375764 RepID=UPI00117C4833|nr:vegetative cell wall protein gp1-like [Sphaeramia orbicularis]
MDGHMTAQRCINQILLPHLILFLQQHQGLVAGAAKEWGSPETPGTQRPQPESHPRPPQRPLTHSIILCSRGSTDPGPATPKPPKQAQGPTTLHTSPVLHALGMQQSLAQCHPAARDPATSAPAPSPNRHHGRTPPPHPDRTPSDVPHPLQPPRHTCSPPPPPPPHHNPPSFTKHTCTSQTPGHAPAHPRSGKSRPAQTPRRMPGPHPTPGGAAPGPQGPGTAPRPPPTSLATRPGGCRPPTQSQPFYF